MSLGSNIQTIRKEHHLSQEQFAEMFNVSRQTISNWENSKSYPDIETIIKLSDSFNVSLDILLKEDMVMVKTIDNEVRNTRKYAGALVIIGVIAVFFSVSFLVYAGVYAHTRDRLETGFDEALWENDFHKNRDEYYSMNYSDGVVFGVPDQKMPGLLDFSLHFHNTQVYCDITLDDVIMEISFVDKDSCYAHAENVKTGEVVSSTKNDETGSEFAGADELVEMGVELGIPEREMERISAKGFELYERFYENSIKK